MAVGDGPVGAAPVSGAVVVAVPATSTGRFATVFAGVLR